MAPRNKPLTAEPNTQRRLLMGSAAGAALWLGCAAAAEEQGAGEEVEANEDLMREHGVLRRALLVYAEAASQLRRGQPVATAPLLEATTLFRHFGEDYHERALEEPHVFPTVRQAGGALATVVEALLQQHVRGRQITAYIEAVTRSGHIADAPAFAGVLDSFVRMYAHHAAVEDTVVFPAWKKRLSKSTYRELSEQFEQLEQRMVGKDGFEDALARIGKVEQAFGIADLAAVTASAPPALPASSAPAPIRAQTPHA